MQIDCKVGICILSELHPNELTDHSTLGRRRKGKIQFRRSNQHSETLTENSIVHLETKRSGGGSANCKVGICKFPELHAELTDCSTLGRRRKESPVS